jgi:hypothetical protein
VVVCHESRLPGANMVLPKLIWSDVYIVGGSSKRRSPSEAKAASAFKVSSSVLPKRCKIQFVVRQVGIERRFTVHQGAEYYDGLFMGQKKEEGGMSAERPRPKRHLKPRQKLDKEKEEAVKLWSNDSGLGTSISLAEDDFDSGLGTSLIRDEDDNFHLYLSDGELTEDEQIAPSDAVDGSCELHIVPTLREVSGEEGDDDDAEDFLRGFDVTVVEEAGQNLAEFREARQRDESKDDKR